MNLANHWRQGNKVRSIDAIDLFTKYGYERLYNIQMNDTWGSYTLDMIAPAGRSDFIDGADGFSFLEEQKYENKSTFLKAFYGGGKKPNF